MPQALHSKPYTQHPKSLVNGSLVPWLWYPPLALGIMTIYFTPICDCFRLFVSPFDDSGYDSYDWKQYKCPGNL